MGNLSEAKVFSSPGAPRKKKARRAKIVNKLKTGVISKFDQSLNDKESIHILNRNSLLLIMKILSFILMLGGLVNFAAQYFLYNEPLHSVLYLTISLFVIGISLFAMAYANIPDEVRVLYITIILTALTPIIIFKFRMFSSITIWVLPFIFIMISLIFTNRVVLVVVSASALLTELVVWATVPEAAVRVNASDHVVRVALLIMAVVIAFYLNSLHIGKLRDIANYIRRIKELAYSDHLTGLPNRLLFNDRLDKAIQSARETDKLIVVIFLDLDNFKMINDTVGHDQGDELLKLVAERLSGILREGDIVSRIGGDEFLVLLQSLPGLDAITRVEERIIQSFKQPFVLNELKYNITASIGAAVFPVDGESAEALIKNADMAMYEAKEKGKNQYVHYSSDMNDQVVENITITNALYRALDHNEMSLVYQPLVCNATGKVRGMEALIRWNHPELGPISPEKFIPIAEKTGLINQIGEWVLRTACAQNKAWQDAGLPRVRVGVNLSVSQFQSHEIVDMVKGILEETCLDPGYLELEITESIAIKEKDYMVEILKAFKRLGVSIAIDDFGTAYSSLEYLKQLPVDRIKIAMTFVHGIAVSEKDEAVTKAIIVLARNLGLNIVAEGVETKNQVAFLNQQMCDEIQGFFYYKPMPAEDMERLMREQRDLFEIVCLV